MAGKDKRISQRAVVRTSLDERGDPRPQEIQEHLEAKYDREIATSIFSNYKFQLRREGGGAIRAEDLEAVRTPGTRLGADQDRRLVGVLA